MSQAARDRGQRRGVRRPGPAAARMALRAQGECPSEAPGLARCQLAGTAPSAGGAGAAAAAPALAGSAGGASAWALRCSR